MKARTFDPNKIIEIKVKDSLKNKDFHEISLNFMEQEKPRSYGKLNLK
jgi:hypothetical protein